MGPPERLLSSGEAARETGISRRTLARYASDGRLRPARSSPARVVAAPSWDLADLRRQLDELQRQAE